MRIEDISNVSGATRITAAGPGARVVVFGGIHGDEVNGLLALRKLRTDFTEGIHELISGSVVLVEANEEAIAQGKWYTGRDLNELFKDPPEPGSSYEHRRVEELKPLLRDCEYFLDLHSAPIIDEPFLVVEKEQIQFFSTMGISKMITGWSTAEGSDSGGSSEEYALAQGARGVTVEAGPDVGVKDPQAIDFVYRSLILFLVQLGMIAPRGDEMIEPPKLEVYEIYYTRAKESDDFAYAGEPKNFAFLPRGAVYGYEHGQPLSVTEDSYLLMPHTPALTAVGEKILYLGRKTS